MSKQTFIQELKTYGYNIIDKDKKVLCKIYYPTNTNRKKDEEHFNKLILAVNNFDELVAILKLTLQRYYDRPINTINNLETDTILKIEKALKSAEVEQ